MNSRSLSVALETSRPERRLEANVEWAVLCEMNHWSSQILHLSESDTVESLTCS